jgi:beta-glucanase (GH16 family)
MPVGDIPGWHQVFADDFITDAPVGTFSGCSQPSGGTILTAHCTGLPPSVAAKWFAYPDGWKDTTGHGTYYPSKVMSIQNGVLNLYIHTENGVHMVAAPVPKIPGGSGSDAGLLHGRYVVRFRSDALPGYKTAWLLWPDSGVWPGDGEIDFPEGNLDGTINAFMHYMNATSGSQQDAYSTTATYPTWHTAVIEWMPSYCSFSLDGTVIGTSTSNIPSTPMHWVLQSETTTDGLVPSDTTAGNIQIDWVAVYTPA